MEEVDVVIIGSGYGGSIPAARLAEAGMKVVVLERGPKISPSDFVQSDDPSYVQSVLDFVVASNNVAFRTGKILGGASNNMDGGMFRMPRRSFEAKDARGRRYWPSIFDRTSLDPYYAKAEDMLEVRQRTWDEIPKAGGLFAKMLDTAGASAELSRMNYRDCRNCGFCTQGCRFQKKVTMGTHYIPLAEQNGAEFRTGAAVDRLEPDRTGYVVRYSKDGVAQSIWGQRVFVAGGGIHTPALLLRSRAALSRLSAHVGENFNNNGEHAWVGILPPEFDDLTTYACYKGMDNAGMMSFHWFEADGFTLHPGGGLEPSVLAATIQHSDHPVVPKLAHGAKYKAFMKTVYPHRLIAFSSLGLAEGHAAITVKSDGTPDIVDRDRRAFDAYLDRLEEVMSDISTRSGVTLIPTVPRKLAGMTSAHLLAGARMAESAEDGVVSPDGEVFGHENLYIADASAVPFSLGVNPALTISAIAERVAEKVIAKG